MLAPLFVNILLFLLCTLTLVTIVFIIAQIKGDNSVMDIAYGPTFFFATLGTIWLSGGTTALGILTCSLIGLWSLRLSVRIWRKNYGKPEDARYAAWRKAWLGRGRGYFLLRSYLQINLLQGAIIMIVALPFIVAHGMSTPSIYPLLSILGLIIFIIGLLYETLADWQLDQFLTRKRAGTEPAAIMQTGLFRYSRRPNYFGETLIWWGLAIIVLPLSFGFIAILSPLLITYIVTKVTGPMLEAVFLKKYPTEYSEYMRTTNYFVPSFLVPSRL